MSKTKVLFIIAILIMLPMVLGTTIDQANQRLGGFTGDGDLAQDDSVKASLDLAHTDLDSIIDYLDATNTLAGHTYTSVKQATATTDDLFDVDGGAILITSLVGVVTTNIQNQANTLEITLDADSGWTDYDFSTAVDIDNDAAGTRFVFTNANESVLTELVGADAGACILMSPWYCGEGMIEQNCSAASTGAITWYMTWIPYEDGTTVEVQ